MAVTWEVELALVDQARQEVRVTATRTDDGVDPPDVWSYSIKSALLDTGAKPEADIIAGLVAMFHKERDEVLAKEAAATSVISGWQEKLEAALLAEEK